MACSQANVLGRWPLRRRLGPLGPQSTDNADLEPGQAERGAGELGDGARVVRIGTLRGSARSRSRCAANREQAGTWALVTAGGERSFGRQQPAFWRSA